jgi:hypothetical protein
MSRATHADPAALVGGMIGCRLTAGQVRAELPWHQLVVLPEPASEITEAAAALAAARGDPVGVGPGKARPPDTPPRPCAVAHLVLPGFPVDYLMSPRSWNGPASSSQGTGIDRNWATVAAPHTAPTGAK